jgi:hypothetical protein
MLILKMEGRVGTYLDHLQGTRCTSSSIQERPFDLEDLHSLHLLNFASLDLLTIQMRQAICKLEWKSNYSVVGAHVDDGVI